MLPQLFAVPIGKVIGRPLAARTAKVFPQRFDRNHNARRARHTDLQ
jgi:hypothetical protein